MGCLQTHLPVTEQVILTQGMKSKWGVDGLRWPTTDTMADMWRQIRRERPENWERSARSVKPERESLLIGFQTLSHKIKTLYKCFQASPEKRCANSAKVNCQHQNLNDDVGCIRATRLNLEALNILHIRTGGNNYVAN